MQKSIFLYLIVLSLTLSLTSCALFENSLLVRPIETYEQFIEQKQDPDFVSMFYFYQEEGCEKCVYVSELIKQFAHEMDNIVKAYHVNCPEIWPTLEDQDSKHKMMYCNPKYIEQLPQLLYVEPPAYRINPYTKKPMTGSDRTYNGKVDLKGMINFCKGFIPAWRKMLDSQSDLESFLSHKKIPNKVILFSNKKDTSILYKGMTSIYRDRLDFAEVREEASYILKKYNIEKFPSLIVLKLNDEKKYDVEMYEGDITFQKIKDFLKQFALEERIQQDDTKFQSSSSEESSQDKNFLGTEPEIIQFKTRKYEKNILQEDKMVLMLIYQQEDQTNLDHFKEITKKFGLMIDYYTFQVNSKEKEEFAKTTLFVKKFPTLKLFPIGTVKKPNAKIFFPTDIDIQELTKDINELVLDNSLAITTEKEMQMYISSAFQEEKLPVILFFQSSMYLSYKAFSHETRFTDKLKFFNIQDPTPELKQTFHVQKLPQMVALISTGEPPQQPSGGGKKKKKQEPQKENQNIQMASFGGKMVYNEMIKFMEQLTDNQGSQPKSNKGGQIQEIKSQDDLEKYCIKKSNICFIAFINAKNIESEGFQNAIEILSEVKDKFSGRPVPVQIMWIDGSCHNYLLERTNIYEDTMPQLLVYYSQKNQYSNQIGTFQVENLSGFVEKALRGQVPKYTLKEEIDIDELNCEDVYKSREEKIKAQQQSKSAEEDEILKEILEEQRLKDQQKAAEKKSKKKKKEEF